MSEEINDDRRRLLATDAMTIAATQLGMIGSANAQSNKTLQLTIEGELPPLSSATPSGSIRSHGCRAACVNCCDLIDSRLLCSKETTPTSEKHTSARQTQTDI